MQQIHKLSNIGKYTALNIDMIRKKNLPVGGPREAQCLGRNAIPARPGGAEGKKEKHLSDRQLMINN